MQSFNARIVPDKLKDVAESMGIDVSHLSAEQGADAALNAIRQLSKDVNIPTGLAELGVKESDFNILSKNALKDVCGFTNPIQASNEEIIEIFRQAM